MRNYRKILCSVVMPIIAFGIALLFAGCKNETDTTLTQQQQSIEKYLQTSHNLTWEVRNGILCHTKGDPAATLEGQVVRLADHIAYINHDIEDALRGGIIFPMDIPLEISSVLGFTHAERVNRLITDAVDASVDKDRIVQSPEVGQAMLALKEFMFANVYTNPLAKGEEGKAAQMVQMLFDYYCKSPDQLPADFQDIRMSEGVERAACDYIAGMTDSYAVSAFEKLFIPAGWALK